MTVDDTAYRNERERLLNRITTVLETDRRVIAAWMVGSFGRGDTDGLSDLDLSVVIEDHEIDPWLPLPSNLWSGSCR